MHIPRQLRASFAQLFKTYIIHGLPITLPRLGNLDVLYSDSSRMSFSALGPPEQWECTLPTHSRIHYVGEASATLWNSISSRDVLLWMNSWLPLNMQPRAANMREKERLQYVQWLTVFRRRSIQTTLASCFVGCHGTTKSSGTHWPTKRMISH